MTVEVSREHIHEAWLEFGTTTMLRFPRQLWGPTTAAFLGWNFGWGEFTRFMRKWLRLQVRERQIRREWRKETRAPFME